MPTGSPPGRRSRRRQRGFTYLLLLFAIALGGAGLARLGDSQRLLAQAEREAEWRFRGQAIAEALAHYAAASPPGTANQPGSLQELLDDRRSPGSPRRHLRQLYADPFTGQPDWTLLRNEQGGITGLHSRSSQPLLRSPAGAGAAISRAADHVFMTSALPTPAEPSGDSNPPQADSPEPNAAP